jgi:hypothetical protein
VVSKVPPRWISCGKICTLVAQQSLEYGLFVGQVYLKHIDAQFDNALACSSDLTVAKTRSFLFESMMVVAKDD